MAVIPTLIPAKAQKARMPFKNSFSQQNGAVPVGTAFFNRCLLVG
jgi:hypothetical protein